MPTRIEWAQETWNPTVGCSRVSAGCDNCYAEREAKRLQRLGAYEGTLDGGRWSGRVNMLPDRMDMPLRWRKPRRVFVDSMSDLFHHNIPEAFVVDVFARMAVCRRHTFQLLTKRPHRMRALMRESVNRGAVAAEATDLLGRTGSYDRWRVEIDPPDWTPVDDGMGSCLWLPPWPLPNVWLGTSIEADRYTFRADHLREIPAAVRWLSLEPLLGPLPSLNLDGVDWVVVGGESGSNARPTDPSAVRDIRDRCVDAAIPFFFKQWGEWVPWEPDAQPPFWNSQHGGFIDGHHLPADLSLGDPVDGWWAADFDNDAIWQRVGKKAAGRELDGRVWDEYPKAG